MKAIIQSSAALLCLTAILHSPITLAEPNDNAYEHTGNAAEHNAEPSNHSPVFGGVSPVPEVDTYAMMLSGLGLVGYVVYRRRGQ